MGHDVKYSTTINDAQLQDLAKNEDRVLLTRDLALFQQSYAKGINTYYVEGNTEAERLAELSVRFDISLEVDLTLSRCSKCNNRLVSVSKQEIVSKIERNTVLYYNEFWACQNCGAVYWQGAHWTKIRATLNEAKQKLEMKNEA
jgi:uncharacterized protein with PIN domain